MATVTTSPISWKSVFLFPFYFFFGDKTLLFFFEGKVSFISVLLSMLVAKREPTPCYRDAYSVGTHKRAFREKGWQKNRKTTGRLFLVSKRTIFFFWEVIVWMFHIGRARHPGPGKRLLTPGQLSVEFVNVGGWLTYGDLASVPGGC